MTEENGNTALKIGLILGGVVSVIVLLSTRKTRSPIVGGTKQTASTLNSTSQFLSENRESIISTLRETSNYYSELLQSASTDIQEIVNRVNSLKETLMKAKTTTLETTGELKELKEESTAIEGSSSNSGSGQLQSVENTQSSS
ncbi:hypothetical protein [uncultured Marinococcus sp.]|uniref:hypothetical protein n=1 Tax=uncultured Marinococcus sp. TaxID=487012 RepID=UPI00262E662A|nr:hypothetical protein [uncultured Marinococcus sp.]